MNLQCETVTIFVDNIVPWAHATMHRMEDKHHPLSTIPLIFIIQGTTYRSLNIVQNTTEKPKAKEKKRFKGQLVTNASCLI